MQLDIKRVVQNEHDALSDKVFSALETGNAGRARLLLTEYAAIHPSEAERLRADVIAEYGVAL